MSDLAPMALLPSEPETLQDRRLLPGALDISRGVARLLHSHQMATISEVALANGRRADMVAVTSGGEIWIVEVKSSIEDFRADHKWPEYRPFCDRLFFAVAPAFPRDILPADAGQIVCGHEHRHQLVTALPDLGTNVLVADVIAEIGKRFLPRAGVRVHRVDQRAIDVEDDCVHYLC